MSIEYYYPLMNLTVVGSTTAKHFTRALNNTDNFNFATETSQGKATEFYIQKITVTNKISDLAVKNKISNATHYLVIKHEINANTTFNVVFPLKDDAKLSDHLNTTRMNGGLAKSIDNLSASTKTVKFSLESVINSMKSFNPKDYYYDETIISTTTTKTYVINDIIYVNKIPNNLFDPGSISIAPASAYTNNKTITKVIKTSDCSGTSKNKPGISKDTLFTVKTKNGRERINYLNMIYGFSALLFVIFFYNIYYRYPKVQMVWQSLLMGIIFVLSLVIIPVATTAQIYNSKNTKMKNGIHKKALQHSVIFAEYLVVAFGFSIGIIFSTNLIGAWNYIKNNTKINAFKHFFWEIPFESMRQIIFSGDKTKMALTIASIIFSGYLGFLIYYIFVKI